MLTAAPAPCHSYLQDIAALQRQLPGPDGQPLQLSEGQVAAVMLAAHSPVSLITGGPGCGKTFVTRAIVRYFKSRGLTVKLCAPTGGRAGAWGKAGCRQLAGGVRLA